MSSPDLGPGSPRAASPTGSARTDSPNTPRTSPSTGSRSCSNGSARSGKGNPTAVRPRGSFPIKATLLFTGIVLVLRLATYYPSRFPLLQPDLLGAAMFLYTPFLFYRRGRTPSWTRLTDGKRNVVLFLALGGGGAMAFLFLSALPLPPFSTPHAAEVPPFRPSPLPQ